MWISVASVVVVAGWRNTGALLARYQVQYGAILEAMLGPVAGEEWQVEPSMPDVCLNPVGAIYRHALTVARVIVSYSSY